MVRTFKDTLIVFLPTFLSGLLMFLSGMLTRKFMDPEAFGLWLTLQLIILYGAFIQLGIINGVHREIPRLLGQSKETEAHRLRELGYSWLLLLFIICAFISIGVLFLDLELKLRILISLSIITVPIQQFLALGRVLYITISDFKKVANIQMIFGPVQSLLTIAFVYLWDIYGMFIAVILANLIGSLYSYLAFDNKMNIYINLKEIKRIMKFGVPLLMVSFAYMLLISFDRMFISFALGPKELGYYSIALLMYQTLIMFPQILEQVLYPKLNFQYGKSKKDEELLTLIENPSKALAIFMPFMLGTVSIITPFFINEFLPNYTNGIQAAIILIQGIFFLAVVGMFTSYLKIIDKQILYLKVLLVSLLMNAVLNFVTLRLGMGIVGVSLSTTITYIFYAFFIIFFSYRYLGKSPIDSVRTFIKISIPFISMILILSILNVLPFVIWLKTLIYILIYIITFSAIYYKKIKELNIKKITNSILRSKSR
jgi:O-antigen/teichoic acid export membrane protein